MRASLYNAMPIEGVKALIDFMARFEKNISEGLNCGMFKVKTAQSHLSFLHGDHDPRTAMKFWTPWPDPDAIFRRATDML